MKKIEFIVMSNLPSIYILEHPNPNLQIGVFLMGNPHYLHSFQPLPKPDFL